MPTDIEARANIAANLNRILADRGWSYTNLAKATGDPLMTISRLCRGQNVPGAGVLARVAEALDVSMDRLVGAPPKNLITAS